MTRERRQKGKKKGGKRGGLQTKSRCVLSPLPRGLTRDKREKDGLEKGREGKEKEGGGEKRPFIFLSLTKDKTREGERGRGGKKEERRG